MKYRHYAPKGELVIVEGEPQKVVQYINEQCAAHEAAGVRTGVIGTKEQLVQYHGATSIKNAGSRYAPGQLQNSFILFCVSLTTRKLHIFMRNPLQIHLL